MNTNVAYLLLTPALLGFLWTALLFSLCFLGVHILKLAKKGWIQTKTPPKKEEEIKKAPAVKQEPIYYIVERKKKRPKTTYEEPKKITFK